MKMGEAMYKAAQAQQGAEQPQGNTESGKKDEEVVDADYEEVKK
jgi:molecular chaperone DnaK